MPVPSNSPEQISSIGAEPQYGEGVQIAEQQAAAPLLNGAVAPAPAPAQPAALPDNVAPKGGNVVNVLPPPNFAPSASGVRPLQPEQHVAYAIMNLAGVSGVARSLAAQLIQQRAVPFDYGVPEPEMPTEEEV